MSKSKKPKETPLNKQYNQIKVKYPGALLLFRVGDFYETFGQDAIKASKILG
ncbi:MAG: DNA mismatch repair protein MutS, partial [Arcticibacterium sp.]